MAFWGGADHFDDYVFLLILAQEFRFGKTCLPAFWELQEKLSQKYLFFGRVARAHKKLFYHTCCNICNRS